MLTDLKRLDGLYVGQLSTEERELLAWGISKGMARIVYTGPAGMLGLGKVEVD